MAYVTTSWGRPIQGVSQQPDRIRLEGQCTEQVNFIPDLVKGLTRRPSTYLIGKLRDGTISATSKFHSYDRGDEAYMMYIEPNSGTVSVYDLNGNRQVVNGSQGYLSHPEPFSGLDLRTIGDFTFITNKDRVTRMSGERSPALEKVGIVYVQYATYGKTYTISVNGTLVASYSTADGAEVTQINGIKTDYVAKRLYTEIVGGTIEDPDGDGGVGSETFPGVDWLTAELHDNVIYIRMADGSDFNLATTDSQKGEDLVAVKGAVKSVTNLPPKAPEGFTVRITGEGKSTKDDYWLKAVNTTESKVRWVETVEPGILISFDATTMPHVLIRESISGGVATFKLQPADWSKREVGGEESNPIPSFIDADNPQTLKATGSFQNRLFFLSGEAWIASRSNLFFNFWRETSQSAIDTDPLDGYADTDKVNNLYTYQILNGDLAIFADSAQFIIKGDKPVTKANLTLQQVTAYPNNVNVTPQAAGENVFFAYNSSGYTGIRELFTDNYSDTKKAYPVTDYVSKYIVGNCCQLLASPNYNSMMVRTWSNLQNVYVYDWLWQGNEKVQSAWHKWVFDGDVLYLFYRDDFMYVVYQKYGNVWMDRLYMLNDPSDVNLEYSICLDHKVTVDAIYDADTGRYNWTMPYDRLEAVATISTGGYDGDLGSAVTVVRASPFSFYTTDRVNDGSNLKLICGVPYMSRYIPTRPVVKDARDRVIGLSSIILSNLYVHYEVTGYLGMRVTPKDLPSRTYEFYGRWMGSSANLVGAPILENGTYRAPIRARAEDMEVLLYSESHYPLTIRDLEGNGTFHQRGQRI